VLQAAVTDRKQRLNLASMRELPLNAACFIRH